MSQRTVAVAVPLIVLLVGAGASLAFAPEPSAPMAAESVAPSTAPVDEVAPAEPAAPEPEPTDATPEPAPEPAPVVEAVLPLIEDVIVRETGSVDMFYHESWTFDVPADSFRLFTVDLGVDDAQHTVDWVAACIQAILKDGAGEPVGEMSAAGFGDGQLLKWSHADGHDGIVWEGTWTVELHVQGVVLNDYSLAVDVLY